ncbi:thiamine-binding protein [Halosolutus amylolyticus]|uniref:Thiamine-binding protein n=1 Tax=Halosolutus amylolyticus TaxID=2932267 RepID=A0ABD5PSR4_9EURY|nr:thiamine-binding protein [Halosolutus amylolyticus]
MTAIGELNVVPVRDGSMAEEIAKAIDALEAFDVADEINPMGTILEADDKRTVSQRAGEKVTAVERHLGRDARRRE